MEKDFGKIARIDLREFFKKEATNFTPWLAENLQELSKGLGIEIIDIHTEKDVGDFRLDS